MNIIISIYCCWIVCSYLTILPTLVTSEEFSKCYNDDNICLWTNGSSLNQSEAQTACQQRNNSFLPRITNSKLQDKLQLFRNNSNLLGGSGFWINVKRVDDVNSFHWIDGSPLAAGGRVLGQHDTNARWAVIIYDTNYKQFVFYARGLTYAVSSYICQLQQGATCSADDLSMNSKCYRKFHNSSQLTWFSASNDCLSHGGSLAVFTDIGFPSNNSQLTRWLSINGTDKSYWIGLVRSWWNTSDENGQSDDIQYSNWERGRPHTDDGKRCVLVTKYNRWITYGCSEKQRFICQNYTNRPIAATTTIPTKTTTRSSNSTSTTKISSSNTASVSSDNTNSLSQPDYRSYVTTTTTWTTTATSMKSTRTTTPYMVNTPSRASSTSSVSDSLSSSTTTTTKTPTEQAVSLDIIIGVVVPCITICIIVIAIAVLVYCYKNKHRKSRSGAGGTSPNGQVGHTATEPDTVTYASIATVQPEEGKNPSGNGINPEQQNVIYSDLRASQS